MGDAYDKKRTAALIEEARQITADLKTETEGIKRQMERMLDGEEDGSLDASLGEKVERDSDFSEGERVPKFFWRFWR